jgi:hypothetical protein
MKRHERPVTWGSLVTLLDGLLFGALLALVISDVLIARGIL